MPRSRLLNRIHTRRSVSALLLCWQFWSGSYALAADRMPESQRQQYELGLKLYEERRYAEAAEAFLAAYRVNQLPRLLQNIAAAHGRIARDVQVDRASRLTAAVTAGNYIDQYLAQPPASRDEKSSAQARHLRDEMTLLRDGLRADNPPPVHQPARTELSERLVNGAERPLHRKGWFVGVMTALGLAVVGGATTAGILLTRPKQPAKDTTIIDLSASTLEIRF